MVFTLEDKIAPSMRTRYFTIICDEQALTSSFCYNFFYLSFRLFFLLSLALAFNSLYKTFLLSIKDKYNNKKIKIKFFFQKYESVGAIYTKTEKSWAQKNIGEKKKNLLIIIQMLKLFEIEIEILFYVFLA